MGFRQSGYFRPVASVDMDPIAAATYESNLHMKVIQKDILDVSAQEIIERGAQRGYGRIAAVAAGPPCRQFSKANTGSTRWNVLKEREGLGNHPSWQKLLSLTLEIQPLLLVVENVAGLTTNGNDVSSSFVKGLEGEGYAVKVTKLEANQFGVPQSRLRVFLIAMKNRETLASVFPLEPVGYSKVTVAEALSDLPKLTNGEPGQQMSMYLGGRPTRYQARMRQGQKVAYDHVCHSVNETMARRFRYIEQGSNLRRALREGRMPLDAMRQYFEGGRIRRFSESTIHAMHSNIYGRLRWDAPSRTIVHVRRAVIIHPLQDRLLSVREAARLQSFPDWFRFTGSLSQQYQQVADAVPPLLAACVARKLGKALSTSESTRSVPGTPLKYQTVELLPVRSKRLPPRDS